MDREIYTEYAVFRKCVSSLSWSQAELFQELLFALRRSVGLIPFT